METDMWIINGKIMTMAGVSYDNGYVRITGNKIASVGGMDSLSWDERAQLEKEKRDALDVNGA